MHVANSISLDADFAPNRIIVTLKHNNSRVNAGVKKSWFVGMDVAEVKDLTAMETTRSRDSVFGMNIEEYEKDYNFHQILLLTLNKSGKTNVVKTIRQLETLDFVLSAEPDYPLFLLGVSDPNDPGFKGKDDPKNLLEWDVEDPHQWGLHNINAPAAWAKYDAEVPDVRVAIVDTGIAIHEDLDELDANGVKIGDGNIDPDLATNFLDPNEIDTNLPPELIYYTDDPREDALGHGTFIAGIIGAVGNNGLGICGVAQKVKLVPCRMNMVPIDNDMNVYYSSAIGAIIYANDYEIPIINASWKAYNLANSPGYPLAPYDPGNVLDPNDGNFMNGMRLIINSYPGLMVCGAGNENWDNDDAVRVYPSSFNLSNIISVAAISSDNTRWAGSNYGATTVHIAAPGDGIWSTAPQSAGLYRYHSGTSYAAPFVAGAAALLKGNFPNATTAHIKKAILNSAVVDDPQNPLPVITGGRLDVLGALDYLNDAYTITFARALGDPSTGTLPEPDIAKLGEFIDLPGQGKLVRPGYTFLGWSADGTTLVPDPYTPTGNVTLRALWQNKLVSKDIRVIVDDNLHYIYGFGPGITWTDMTTNYLEVIGGGSLSPITQGQTYIGTGFMMRFYYDPANPASYVVYAFVLFGDYDGDGFLTNSDVSYCLNLIGITPSVMTPHVFAMGFDNDTNYYAAPSMDTRRLIQDYVKGYTWSIDFGYFAAVRFRIAKNWFILNG